jgi:hypothetical protein
MMMNTLWAVVRDGKIELLEYGALHEGARVLVTLLPEDEKAQFWLGVTKSALDAIWGNEEDDIYAELRQVRRNPCALSVL